jgi:putative transposase
MMSYNQLRIGRLSLPHQHYFVTTVVNDRQPVFRDFVLARMLIRSMRELHDNRRIISLAWVVMPDHLHWLFELPPNSDLSKTIAQFKGKTSRMLNTHLGRCGPFWQPSFYDHCLRKEDIISVARYIVANPLRDGLTKSLEQYSHWDAIWF